MEKFSAEEMILIRLYDLHNRTQLIEELKDSLHYVLYPEELKLMQIIIGKLENMTDGEYANIGLFPDFNLYEQEV